MPLHRNLICVCGIGFSAHIYLHSSNFCLYLCVWEKRASSLMLQWFANVIANVIIKSFNWEPSIVLWIWTILTQGQLISKAIYGVLNSSKKQTKITILGIFLLTNMLRIVSVIHFFGRIESTTIFFEIYYAFIEKFQQNNVLHTCCINYLLTTFNYFPASNFIFPVSVFIDRRNMFSCLNMAT
mgnify:CR=1 FL=1